MAFFGLFATESDLDKILEKLRLLYQQAVDPRRSTMSRAELKHELKKQLNKLLDVCERGNFHGSQMVEWPTSGCLTSLRNVTPEVQVLIEMI